jgi:hypothetical protein
MSSEDVDFEGLELIEMRLEIDVPKVLAYLEANSDFPPGGAVVLRTIRTPHASAPYARPTTRALAVQVKQFNKGQSNPTYFIQDSNGARWVLRKQPPGKLLKGAHQVDREFKVFSALADTPVPVPKMLLFCGDTSILGTTFYVMEFINGRICEDIALVDETPANRAAIYDSLAQVMAALHQVDHEAVGLGDFGKPSGYVQRQLKTWGRIYAQQEVFVRDPKAWEKVGLEFIDNGDYMGRLLAYLNAHVDEEMSRWAALSCSSARPDAPAGLTGSGRGQDGAGAGWNRARCGDIPLGLYYIFRRSPSLRA